MGVGRIFSRGGQKWIFPDGAKNIFPWGSKSGKISFYPLETKKTTFFAKNLTGKYQNSNSKAGAWSPCLPLPTTIPEVMFHVECIGRKCMGCIPECALSTC